MQSPSSECPFSCILYHEPIPLARPRFIQKGSFSAICDSQKELKVSVRRRLKENLADRTLISGIIYFSIDCIFAMPASWSAKKREELDGQIHTQKPDLDNIIKFYSDCLSGFIIEDDRMIGSIMASKRWGQADQVKIQLFA